LQSERDRRSGRCRSRQGSGSRRFAVAAGPVLRAPHPPWRREMLSHFGDRPLPLPLFSL